MEKDKITGNQEEKETVDINNPEDVGYLQKHFPGKTVQQIADAIKAAGPVRRHIISYLEGYPQ